jgi:hypothetical protein
LGITAINISRFACGNPLVSCHFTKPEFWFQNSGRPDFRFRNSRLVLCFLIVFPVA